jgi:hypothetical protein
VNPPYSRELLPLFIDKLMNEFAVGGVSEAVCLTHASTDARWFQSLASAAAAICFPRDRLKFVGVNGQESAPTQGQALSYLGRRHREFAEHFRPVGFVVKPVQH